MEAAKRITLLLSFSLSCFANVPPRVFPKDFIFGTGVSAYQTEGAWNEDGKGENNLDSLFHKHPEFIVDRRNADVSCNSYHLWRRDIEMLKYLGINAYKFSISWTRILPLGFSSYVNPAGIRFYSDFIDELLKNGIEPMVVIHHSDMPVDLSRIGGFANSLIIEFYTDFAMVLFENFGDRVKKWITINEPIAVCTRGVTLPARVGEYTRYYCGQNVLLAHSAVYHKYREQFYASQKGQIGMSFESFWHEPKTETIEDIKAANRGWTFNFGWFTHPLLSKTGDYNPEMKARIKYLSEQQNSKRSRLPQLSLSQINRIRGTLDFVGINYYTTNIATAINDSLDMAWDADVGALVSPDLACTRSDVKWLSSYPKGLEKVIRYIKAEYDNPVVYITENGFADAEMKDIRRINYLRDHLNVVLDAINGGSNVKGYFAWSLMDNWEWRAGYTVKFGLYHVNFDDVNLTRTPRDSAKWYSQVTKTYRLI